MSNFSALPENSRYEQACDQAIAMCNGNLRSTIKALIMANESRGGARGIADGNRRRLRTSRCAARAQQRRLIVNPAESDVVGNATNPG
jgi:hypothetical protein